MRGYAIAFPSVMDVPVASGVPSIKGDAIPSRDDRCVYIDIHLTRANVLDHVPDLMLIFLWLYIALLQRSIQLAPDSANFYFYILVVGTGETRFQWNRLYVPNRQVRRCVIPMPGL